MASKVTSLYAQTRILPNLWALDDLPVTKSNVLPKGKAYATALDQLVENGGLIDILPGLKARRFSG